MKAINCFLVACFCVLMTLAFSQSAEAMPLKQGSYRIGSNYKDVHVQGNRICYVESTAMTGFVSSVKKSPDMDDYYYLEAVEGEPTYLKQKDDETLLMGKLDNMDEMTMESPFNEKTDIVEECLSSAGKFSYFASNEPELEIDH